MFHTLCVLINVWILILTFLFLKTSKERSLLIHRISIICFIDFSTSRLNSFLLFIWFRHLLSLSNRERERETSSSRFGNYSLVVTVKLVSSFVWFHLLFDLIIIPYESVLRRRFAVFLLISIEIISTFKDLFFVCFSLFGRSPSDLVNRIEFSSDI